MDINQQIEETLTEDGLVVTKSYNDGLVTCNLSSLNYGKVFTTEHEKDLQRIVDIQVRMLDNVISMNRAVVPHAIHTNDRYRAIGAGSMGVVRYLTDNGIKWESNKASETFEQLFKKQLQATIEASHKLSNEKGSYPYFEGSDWNTGEFFDKRGFYSEEWDKYREMASKGMRNSYLLAVAPTSSNSMISNTSPSIDPPYAVVYREKKEGINLMYIPSNYNNRTKWFYKSGFEMDEMWAIQHVASAQKYVDQGISHNMHVSKDISASELLRLDMGAWERGLKTIYYTYVQGNGLAEDCIMCEG